MNDDVIVKKLVKEIKNIELEKSKDIYSDENQVKYDVVNLILDVLEGVFSNDNK